jgi:hypothetical protein
MASPVLLPLVTPSPGAGASATTQLARESTRTNLDTRLRTKTAQTNCRRARPDPSAVAPEKCTNEFPGAARPNPTAPRLCGSSHERTSPPHVRTRRAVRPGRVHARHQRRNEPEPRHPLPVPERTNELGIVRDPVCGLRRLAHARTWPGCRAHGRHERRGVHGPAHMGLGAGWRNEPEGHRLAAGLVAPARAAMPATPWVELVQHRTCMGWRRRAG